MLVVRYLFNHPEALILLALLLALGARVTLQWKPGRNGAKPNTFWLPPLALGVLIWGIYAIVNTEERYVTVAYLAIILTLFAALRVPGTSNHRESPGAPSLSVSSARVGTMRPNRLRPGASARAAGRRRIAAHGPRRPPRRSRASAMRDGWYSPTMDQVAAGLRAIGVRPGDTIACTGWSACLDDPYWARLGRRPHHHRDLRRHHSRLRFLADLPNRDQAIAVVRGQGASVLVADFGDARVSDSDPFFRNWRQLGDTTFYALPLK